MNVQARNGPFALRSDLAVCVWIQHFALLCEEYRRPETTEYPNALLAPEDSRRIWQAGPRARKSGVRPGMTASQAVGLCPSLTVWEPDPVYYDEQFSRLVKALGNVSPSIEPAELGLVFVGVDGLDTLLGEPRKQVKAVRAVLDREWRKCEGVGMPGLTESGEEDEADSVVGSVGWGGVARLGWARGKFAAWVAATKARPREPCIVTDEVRAGFLASQPIGVLRMSSDTHRRLMQLSIKRVRDLTQLPEQAVVSQFGNEGRRLWQLATGAVVDSVVGRDTPEPIVSEIDFPNPIADIGVLCNAVDRLVERALRHPRRSGWRVLEVGVRARQEFGASLAMRSTLKDPSADKDHIAAPLKVRLVSTPPTGAVETLAVEFLTFVRGTSELQLFARDANSSARAGRRRALRAAIREMKARFKRSSVYRVVEVYPGSRIPERRYALLDYDP